MPLLTLNLSCENVKYLARKHFEKTNSNNIASWEWPYPREIVDKIE